MSIPFLKFFKFFQNFFKKWKTGWETGEGLKLAFENSLIDIIITNFYRTPLDIFFSYVLFKKFYGHSFFRAVFYLPVIFGEIATTIMQGYVLDATGPIVILGSKLGIEMPFEAMQSGLLGNFKTARSTFGKRTK